MTTDHNRSPCSDVVSGLIGRYPAVKENTMKTTISINMGNDAFTDHPGGEVARILRDLAARLDMDGSFGQHGYEETLRDYNGNTVGTISVSE